jgi:pheromone shutdown-related protein TraB
VGESENVTILNTAGKTIHLVGTAHVSQESAKEAYETILEARPQAVCVELDDERLYSLTHSADWSQTNISDIIKQKRSSFMLASIILSSYQKRLAKQFDISAGQEMIESMKAAEEIGARVVPIDRSISSTFLRIWRHLSFWEKLKLVFTGLVSFLSDEEISEEELAELKSKDMLESALSEMSSSFPNVKKYLVDERDVYLAAGIRECPEERIVAVIGAAHKSGVIQHIGDENVDRGALSEIPAPSKIGKALAWGIPAILVAMFALTLAQDASAGFEQLKRWTLYTSVLAALGTLLAGGHIATILTSLAVAPLTAIHPLLAVGWFAGLTEAKLRNPTVGDFESLSDDLTSARGLWRNKVTRILLVIVFANIGGTIGTFIGGANIFKIFSDIFLK